jgi:hypothetical protein
MIPKLDISMPELFVRAFHFAKRYGYPGKLDDDARDFKKFFEQHGESILEQIEKLSGFNWTSERIPVYLFPNSHISPPYSFSKINLENDLPGVMQKLGVSPKQISDYWVCIHELVHINQKEKEFYDKYFFNVGTIKNNTDLLELCADLVTLNVVRNLFDRDSELEKDLWDFLDFSNDKNKRKAEILRTYLDLWDLSKNNLRYYLDQTPQDKLENLI